MAYKEPINYGFADRYASLRTDDQIRQQAFRTAQMAREDAAGRRIEEAASRSDRVFGEANAQLREDKTGDSPATIAYGYTRALADITSYVASGDLESAYKVYSTRLLEPAQRFHNEFIDFGTAAPRTKNEAAIQTGAQEISLGNYDQHQIALPGGAQTTVGALFRDGKTYKRFQKDTVLQKNFSEATVSGYNSEDSFKRGVFESIVDPVLRDTNHQYRLQHSRLGHYVAQNYDDLLASFGRDGLRLVINDAVDRRVKNGTDLDRIRSLKAIVDAQAGSDSDRYWLVENGISQLDRSVSASTTVPNGSATSPSAERLAAKEMTWALTDPRYQGVSVNFDDDDVRAQMSELNTFFATAEKLRIPFLSDAHAGGAPVRNAVSELIHAANAKGDVSDGNFIRQAQSSLSFCQNLLSGGCAPSSSKPSVDPASDDNPASVFGSTTGSDLLDSARKSMLKTLWGDIVVPSQARGKRSDIAIRDLCRPDSRERAELVSGWTRDIAEKTLISPAAAEYLASGLVSEAFGADGTVRAPNLPETMKRLAFDKKLGEENPEVQRELIRWYKAENILAPMLVGAEQEILPYITDPYVGQGLKTKEQVAVALGKFRRDCEILAERGIPFTHAVNAVKKTCRWLAPSGRSILADGSVATIVPDAKFAKLSPEQRRGAISDRDPRAKGHRPELVQQSGNINEASVEPVSVGGVTTQRIRPGDWEKNENAVRATQMVLRQIFDSNLKITDAADRKAATTQNPFSM